MAIEDACVITGGVDTHADMHVAAALDPLGGLPGVREFPATAVGYADLLSWLSGSGTVALAGVEGTGSYGAGLARALAAAGIGVVEVDRAGRQDRHRQGKPDPLDAVSAARAAQSGRAASAPKGRDGAVEAIRALMVARRSARAERTQAINQARALIVTGPDELRARFARHTPAQLVAVLAALRPRPGDVPGHATRIALREPGRRARFPDAQIEHLDELIVPLVTARAPGLPGLHATSRAHLLSGSPDRSIGCPPQRTLLLTAKHQLGQLLAASVGKLPDQPPPKSVSNKHHTSSLPATVQPSGIPCYRRCCRHPRLRVPTRQLNLDAVISPAMISWTPPLRPCRARPATCS
jgi:transposase